MIRLKRFLILLENMFMQCNMFEGEFNLNGFLIIFKIEITVTSFLYSLHNEINYLLTLFRVLQGTTKHFILYPIASLLL